MPPIQRPAEAVRVTPPLHTERHVPVSWPGLRRPSASPRHTCPRVGGTRTHAPRSAPPWPRRGPGDAVTFGERWRRARGTVLSGWPLPPGELGWRACGLATPGGYIEQGRGRNSSQRSCKQTGRGWNCGTLPFLWLVHPLRYVCGEDGLTLMARRSRVWRMAASVSSPLVAPRRRRKDATHTSARLHNPHTPP